MEEEPSDSGKPVSVATLFLTNRECPWRCLMCDLWQNTLTETVPVGAIPAQIDYALAELARSEAAAEPRNTESTGPVRKRSAQPARTRWIKLYNSGSFFDPNAIPIADYEAIADRVRGFERVIVECHPALVNDAILRFRDLLATAPSSASQNHRVQSVTRLEVAMGLETAHPDVLSRLNKRMTLEQFSRAAAFLKTSDIDLRVFILVKPPFLDERNALTWAKRSLDFAFENGASVASLIPTRFGNGALEELARTGEFAPPKLFTLEAAFAHGLSLKRGRILADLWDLQRFSQCAACFEKRLDRLHQMNLQQVELPGLHCERCGGAT